MGDSAPLGALWQVWVFVVFKEENTMFLNHKETAAVLGYKTRQLEHLRLTYDKGCAPEHTYIDRKIAYSEEELIRWTKLQRDNAIEAAERLCAERLERLAEFVNDNAPLEARKVLRHRKTPADRISEGLRISTTTHRNEEVSND